MTSPRISDLTRRLQREPGSRVFFELAREHHQSGNLEEAAKLCSEGLQTHPAYHSARVLLGRILIEMKQFSRAKPELERVMKQAPDNLLARRLLADALGGENDRKGAVEILRGLLVLNPTDEEAEQRIQELSALVENERAGTKTLPGGTASQELPLAEEVAEPAEPESERATSAFEYQGPPGSPAVAMASPEAEPEPEAVEPPLLSPASATATVMMRPGDLSGAIAGGATKGGSRAATVMMRPDDLRDAADKPRVEAHAAPPSVTGQVRAEIVKEGWGGPTGARDEQNEPTLGALPTPTLAEIYLTQGMPERALEIYKQVLAGDPHNQEALARVREISGQPAPGGDLPHRKIQVLEGWLERIRRHHHVQNDAGRGGPKTAGV